MDTMHGFWQELAGPHYLSIMQSPTCALDHLSHDDPDVRIAALHICARHWKLVRSQKFIEHLVILAVADANQQVRIHAIDLLGNSLAATKDKRISTILADITATDSNSDELRFASYCALRLIQMGISRENLRMRTEAQIEKAKAKLATKRESESRVDSVRKSTNENNAQNEDLLNRIDWTLVTAHRNV